MRGTPERAVFQVFLSVSDSVYLDISTFVEYNYSTNIEQGWEG